MFWLNALIDVLLVLFVLVCVLMCLVVLMQRSKQEGLGAAFGGGFTDSVFGAQTSQVLVKTTAWLAAAFFILSISLARLYSHRTELEHKGSAAHQLLLQSAAPTQTSAQNPVTPTAPVVPTATPMTSAPATNAASMTPASTNAPAGAK
jgi:preprotein translocase subunit SecG